MRRVAYLCGVAGGGKSTLSGRFKDAGVAVIAGDGMMKWAATRLCPYLNPKHAWSPDLWEALSRHCDLRPAFRLTLLDSFGKQLSSDLPILAEAVLFGRRPVREAIHGALLDIEPRGLERKTFWLQPSATELVARHNGRIHLGGRPNEKPIDVAEAAKRLDSYDGRMRDSDDYRSGNPDDMAEEIRKFLLPG